MYPRSDKFNKNGVEDELLKQLTPEKEKMIEDLKKKVFELEIYKKHEDFFKTFVDKIFFVKYLLHTFWKPKESMKYIKEVLEFKLEVRNYDYKEILEIIKEKKYEDVNLIKVYGYTPEGRPIIYVKFGDIKKIKKKDLEFLFKCLVVMCEFMFSDQVLPKGMYYCDFIVDVGGIGVPFLSRVRRIAKVFSPMANHYTETLNKAYVVNSSWIINSAWKIAKLFMYKETCEKVVWLKKVSDLKKHFDEDELITEYGGKKEFKYIFKDYLEYKIAQQKKEREKEDLKKQESSIDDTQ